MISICPHFTEFPVTGSHGLHDGLTRSVWCQQSHNCCWRWSDGLFPTALTSHTLRTACSFGLNMFWKAERAGNQCLLFYFGSPHRILSETEAELLSWNPLNLLSVTFFSCLLFIHWLIFKTCVQGTLEIEAKVPAVKGDNLVAEWNGLNDTGLYIITW